MPLPTCPGTVGSVVTSFDGGVTTTHVATCSVAWEAAPDPNTFNATEFGEYFAATFILSMVFYFTVVFPGVAIINAARKARKV